MIYYVTVTRRTRRPRNKRLRETGGASYTSGSTTILTGESGGSGGVGHTHDNKNDLDKITTDNEGYLYLTYYVETLNDDGTTSVEQVTEKVKAGWADAAGYAEEAYTLSADSPIWNELDTKYLSRLEDDTAAGVITFEQGVIFGNYVASVSGGYFGADGKGEVSEVVVRSLLRSPVFVDGLTGEGFQLWEQAGDWSLTLDRLTVRKTMTVFELMVQGSSSVAGELIVSASNGTIASAELDGDYWIITLEGENSFQEGDLIRCQSWTGTSEKYYWVEVSSVDGQTITVAASEFEDGVEPEEGDGIVLLGNTKNERRQNAVVITATEDGAPRVAVYNGIHEKSFSGCLTARLGTLDNVSESHFTDTLEGDGLYSGTAYLYDSFHFLAAGTDETSVEMASDGVTTTVRTVQARAEVDFSLFTAGGDYIWANDGPLSTTLLLQTEGGSRYQTTTDQKDDELHLFAVQYDETGSTEQRQAGIRIGAKESEWYVQTADGVEGSVALTTGTLVYPDTDSVTEVGSRLVVETDNTIVNSETVVNGYVYFNTDRSDTYAAEQVIIDRQTQTGSNSALSIDVQGATEYTCTTQTGSVANDILRGNHALLIHAGDIAGLRPHTRYIESTTTTTGSPYELTEYDSVLFVNGTFTQLSLPSNPQNGQTYIVHNIGRYESTIAFLSTGSVNGIRFIFANAVYEQGSTTSFSNAGMMWLFYDAYSNYWYTYRFATTETDRNE